MPHSSRAATFAALAIIGCGVSASAETLRCQSVNGNLNCAGSNGVSCQTINGKKVCVSGRGDAIQSFGGGSVGRGAATDVFSDDELDDTPASKHRLQHVGTPYPQMDPMATDGD